MLTRPRYERATSVPSGTRMSPRKGTRTVTDRDEHVYRMKCAFQDERARREGAGHVAWVLLVGLWWDPSRSRPTARERAPAVMAGCAGRVVSPSLIHARRRNCGKR